MNNLSYPRKLIVLGGLSLLSLLIVSISLLVYLSGSISTANQQLEGLKQAQKTSRLIQSLQQHRGMSAAVIAGVNDSAVKQMSVNNQVGENFIKVSNALPSELKQVGKWSTIRINSQFKFFTAKSG